MQVLEIRVTSILIINDAAQKHFWLLIVFRHLLDFDARCSHTFSIIYNAPYQIIHMLFE